VLDGVCVLVKRVEKEEEGFSGDRKKEQNIKSLKESKGLKMSFSLTYWEEDVIFSGALIESVSANNIYNICQYQWRTVIFNFKI
jgi:hypothetical protein